jgi:nucleoside-diphosphate-sugar epimerase
MTNLTYSMSNKKSAVLTGGSGYIGKNVTKELLQNGWQVFHLVRKKPKLKLCIPKIKYLKINKSLSSLSKLLKLNRKKTVFIHLATYSSIKNELKNTKNYIDSNINLGVNLMSFMHHNSFTKLLIAESYWQFDGKGKIKGNTLYSLSKSCLSNIAEYFSIKYNFIINCLVLYDIYGPGDDRPKLLNQLIDNLNKRKIFKLTPGKQIIDYTFINDVAKAFVVASENLILKKKNQFKRYTVRSMHQKTLKSYINIIENSLNYKFNINWGGKKYPNYQIMKPWLPSSKYQLPSWSPESKFENNIKNLIKK